MGYGVDLKERAIRLVEGWGTTAEVAKLLNLGEASLYRWINKQEEGGSLATQARKRFIRKIDPQELAAYVKEALRSDASRAESDIGS